MGRLRSRRDPEGLFSFPAEVSYWAYPVTLPNRTRAGADIFQGWQSAPAVWVPNSNQISSQVTVDENHALHDPSTLRGGLYDVGGAFDSQRYILASDAAIYTLNTRQGADYQDDPYNHFATYKGPVFATDPTVLLPGQTFGRATDVALRGQGTTAISRCKPTNHISNLANDMTEIYHGQLPNLPGRRLWKPKTRRAKAAGNEYLNVAFGWLPLVSDLQDAMYAAANSERLMKAYEENSGKPVRRRYEFPPEETFSSSVGAPSNGHIGIQGNWNTSYHTGFNDSNIPMPASRVTTRYLREVWFSGCFTYYLPVEYKSRNRIAKIAAQAEHLYGLELTPDVLWQVTPWTWAIDWFSNAGDVVSNLSSWQTDGMVMYYGYLMERIVRETTYTLDGPTQWRSANGKYVYASPVSVRYESKRRIRATPFGFDSDFNSLSLRQLAITVALGLSKMWR